MRRRLGAAALIVFIGGSVAAQAGDRWSVAVLGGTDVEVSGDVLQAGEGSIAGLATTVGALSYGGAFSPSFRGSVSLGYRVSPTLEVFARGGRYSMNGKSAGVGSASGLDLTADAATCREWSVEAGVRRSFATHGAFEPYVAFAGGLRSLDAIAMTLSVPDAHLSAAGLPLYDKSTVAVFGADAGARWRVSSHAFVGADVGLRYQAAPRGIDSGLQGSGLEVVNDGGSRLALPISAEIGVRF